MVELAKLDDPEKPGQAPAKSVAAIGAMPEDAARVRLIEGTGRILVSAGDAGVPGQKGHRGEDEPGSPAAAEPEAGNPASEGTERGKSGKKGKSEAKKKKGIRVETAAIHAEKPDGKGGAAWSRVMREAGAKLAFKLLAALLLANGLPVRASQRVFPVGGASSLRTRVYAIFGPAAVVIPGWLHLKKRCSELRAWPAAAAGSARGSSCGSCRCSGRARPGGLREASRSFARRPEEPGQDGGSSSAA
jgi:hypothetical protein